MKINRIKTTYLRNFGKILLWILVIFLLFCGVKSILSQGEDDVLENMISDYQSESKIIEQTKIGGSAFAESFVYEYFTYNGQLNSDYLDRVNRYVASGVDIKNPNSGVTEAEAISAQTINVHFINEKQMDIDILSKIRYTALGGASPGEVSEQDIYLRVPVIAENVKKGKGGNYAIGSLPMIIPSNEKAEARSISGYAGTEVNKDYKDELKVVLESFFKTYYEGTESEISYYVSEGANIKNSLASAFIFEKINQISATTDEKTGEVLVETKISIIDHGQPIDQRLFLRVEEIKDKFYIKMISTRPL